jgi:hypothetical protein
MCALNKTTTTFVTFFSRISQAVVLVYSLNHVHPEPLERGKFTLWRAIVTNNDDICNLLFSRIF